MATYSFPGYIDTEVGPYYLFSLGSSLADWLSGRIEIFEAVAPNSGLWGYGIIVNDGIWYVFRGASQPASWGEAIGVWSSPDIAGNGEYAVQIRVRSLGINISGALVSVFNGASLLTWGSTNSNGIVTFNLPSGLLDINVSAAGFEAISGQDITVPVGAIVEVSMVAHSIAPPPGILGLSSVQVAVKTSDDIAVEDAVVNAILESGSMTDGYLIANSVISGVTNAEGITVLTLVQSSQFEFGGVYTITVTLPNGSITLQRRARIPNIASYTINNLLFV